MERVGGGSPQPPPRPTGAPMATIQGPPIYGLPPAASTVNLGTSQTGNVDTTNTADRGNLVSGAYLKIVSTVGATPTVTVNIQGSINGTDFFNVPHAPVAPPSAVWVR